MPLPQLSKQITKIISLTFFGIITIIKLICILIINAHKDTPCIAGWHVNEEIADHLILISMTLIPDILMLVCIGVGMVFETSNIGADPGTIVYNFIVGLLTICSLLPFFGIEDCRSDNLKNIKSVGIYATIAGVLHIANGVVCLLFLAPEERYEMETEEALNSTPKSRENSEEKPSTSKPSSTSK